MIQVADNFNYRGKKPNFDRDSFDTLQDMKNYSENSLDDGHISYCKETNKHYKFNSNNQSDPTTGKWVEQHEAVPADEEDITEQNGTLQLANKTYDKQSFSGLGRVYLRKNIVGDKNVLTQAMINKANTIYVIQYDYDLKEASINIPENCVLQFDGGSLSNGNITLNNTSISSKCNKIFDFKLLSQNATICVPIRIFNISFVDNISKNNIELLLTIKNSIDQCKLTITSYDNINNLDTEYKHFFIGKDDAGNYGVYSDKSTSIIRIEIDILWQSLYKPNIYNLILSTQEFGVDNSTYNEEQVEIIKYSQYLEGLEYTKYRTGKLTVLDNKEAYIPLLVISKDNSIDNLPTNSSSTFKYFVYNSQTKKLNYRYGDNLYTINSTIVTENNQRPSLSNVDKGTMYFDNTLNKPIFWDGTKWIDATGATV